MSTGEWAWGQRVNIKTAVIGAIIFGEIAGMVMAMFMMFADLVAGKGFWFTPALLSTLILRGQEITGAFQLVPIIIGMMIHMMMSPALGLVAILGLRRVVASALGSSTENAAPRITIAAVFGVVVFFMMMHLALPIVQPRIASEVAYVPFLLAHMMYGIVLGIYPTPTRQ